MQFLRPTKEMVEAIAADMRPADAAEVWASNHHTPLESLMKGWALSDFVTVVVCDGQPLVMIGLVKRDILSGGGTVWMLGSNRAMKYKREFLTRSRAVVYEMLTICPRLSNYVHDKNRSSIRWLKWLGFTLSDPVPYGPDGEMFHPFYIERRDGCVVQQRSRQLRRW